MKHAFGIVFFLLLSACGMGTDTPSKSIGNIGSKDYVSISRTACFGSCPAYKLTLFGDGRIEFHGTRYTKIMGTERGQGSTGQFLEVISMLEVREFAGLADDYSRNTCKIWATDHPNVHIEVKSASLVKTVDWYTGCRGLKVRAKLEAIANELDRILGADRFVGTVEERKSPHR